MSDTVTINNSRGPIAYTVASIAFLVVCAAGFYWILKGLFSPDLEWRLLAMVALSFVFSPYNTELSSGDGRVSLRIPLVHPVLFASAIALGPTGAALTGVFGGIARVISLTNGDETKPLSQVMWITFKPAVVGVAAGWAYVAVGGDVISSHQLISWLPLLCSAVAYIGVGVFLILVVDELFNYESNATPRGSAAFTVCALCFLGGYILAVLYALVPAYVILAPAAVAVYTEYSMKHKKATAKIESTAAPVVEIEEVKAECDMEESDGFVDELTGLANQRYLSMFLNRELGRAERSGAPISVAVFDIAGYKKMKDTVGQDEAEQLLVDVGQCLKKGLRNYDLIGRYGLGRFIVVLPEASTDAAYEVAERLHNSAIGLQAAGRDGFVSAGIATYPEHGLTAEELINAAHYALNRGRFGGGSGIFVYNDLAQAS